MVSKIFINLAVKDLKKSIAFFTKLGFSFNPKFTDESATCMIIAENIFAMLLTEERFKDFTKKEICNAHKNTEVLIAIAVESREKVDELVKNAVDAGGSIYMNQQDHGWMYVHSFADLDGHQWEILYMDESAIPKR
ncbi:VOC family protein [Flavobacterium gawalongense]|uniref:Glyoxalase/bleomycin resistance/extradiol dioxygenase family protein n=1 Tax=Flavobacterium gawalongense TaxID=2594432 RepID=A0A553BS64_9FLAO|nr:VOC family protein [Flavobacterium gawalongense]TRX03187.1 glyoxalase/bleomycin resistance/extradiol dioxygenase family protein [Flavobacterium gawalongense]TRX09849.1 glyoxalase/bleomycin resistance/extradiol dioxygenase family protein [Flavobacterium gawalongense]TRX11077.1 glyoxalase/bleomycin resistance/extradiol dioxygenase family protein [Flavobacterium gawalongense]TRX11960.1 glyoxalase/bleomycin resistance/extradiol dioxygenase family protein [Flavobacterium gawalongense]TRX29806.1 